jgi:hypothetical protein
MIYCAGRMLIRRSVLEDYLDEPFSHAFAFTGGSDLKFFTRCRRDGRFFAWADSAFALETTPPERTCVSWLPRVARTPRSGEQPEPGRARAPAASRRNSTSSTSNTVNAETCRLAQTKRVP